ncbi:MAG: hypothetical protein AAF138_10815 [Planctomycetota bacterium]
MSWPVRRSCKSGGLACWACWACGGVLAWPVLPWSVLAWFVLSLTALSPAIAQDDGAIGIQPEDVGGPVAGTGTGEVRVDIDSIGFGGARPGDWTGLRLSVLDTAERPRTLLIRWTGYDQDGDSPLYERAIANNPGQRLSVWLYGRLPHGFNSDTPIEVSVYEGLEGEAGAEGVGYRAGRLLGRALTSISASGAGVGRLSLETSARYAIVGTSGMGLPRYATRPPNMANANWAPLAHELVELQGGLTPEQFPDRWMGLASTEVIVWERGDPADLRVARSRALRRWVERGGHLIVVLPAAGQEWSASLNNRLADVLPRVSIERREGADLELYRGLLTGERPGRLEPRVIPARGVVHVFEPMADAEPLEAIPLLAGADGSVVVSRRIVGVGMVTVVGLNLRAPSLAALGLPSADAFWNRVLGRRGRFPSAEELKSDQLRVFSDVASSSRRAVVYDAGISTMISKTGRAAVGLLAGLGLGVAYILVAGPVGFAVLKRTNRTRHAWVMFVAAAGVFTAAAWTAAASLRPRQVDGTHLTFLEHVYGQPIQRARTWMGVLLPGYGDATLRVGEAPGARDRADGSGAWDLIAPWEPMAGGARGGFPDARGYAVQASAPDSITVPTRATVKRIRADWAGGPRWSMPRPVGGAEPVLTPESTWRAGPMMTGTLEHELPAAIDRPLFIVVPPQEDVGAAPPGDLITRARAFVLSESWAPGVPIDLASLTADGTEVASYLRTYANDRTDRPQGFGSGLTAAADIVSNPDRLYALAVFGQLMPPQIQDTDAGREPIVAARRASHGWDVDRWLTQPGLIVIGRVETSGRGACPSPIYVGDETEPVRSTGVTMVRWIYPLEASPPKTAPSAPSMDDDGA